MQNLFKAKTQEEFLVTAYSFHRKKTYIDKWNFYCGPDWKSIIWLFKLGVDLRTLHITYEQFVRIMTGNERNYYNGFYRPRRGCSQCKGYYNYFCDTKSYRVLTGFTYNGQVKKAKPSQNEWRQCKGLNKTRRKPRHYGSWKKNLKHFCKRKHRQLERQAIRVEHYSKLHQWSYKQAEDPWYWD